MAKKHILPEPFFTLELDGQEVQRFSLDRARTSIGRARDSEIQIAVRGVSRTHAVVLRDEQGRCVLEDLGSANGTFVNGARIPGKHVLEIGDVVNFLDYALRFHREGPASADQEGLDTDSSEIPLKGEAFGEDDAIPTEEGPAMKGLRNQTVTGDGGAPSKPARAEARPIWELDVDDPELGRATHRLDGEVTVVGGEESSQVRLSGRRLERIHSLFVRVEEKILFVRLSPVHIARVNGTARMVSFLQPGDEISIGGSTLVVRKR